MKPQPTLHSAITHGAIVIPDPVPTPPISEIRDDVPQSRAPSAIPSVETAAPKFRDYINELRTRARNAQVWPAPVKLLESALNAEERRELIQIWEDAKDARNRASRFGNNMVSVELQRQRDALNAAPETAPAVQTRGAIGFDYIARREAILGAFVKKNWENYFSLIQPALFKVVPILEREIKKLINRDEAEAQAVGIPREMCVPDAVTECLIRAWENALAFSEMVEAEIVAIEQNPTNYGWNPNESILNLLGISTR